MADLSALAAKYGGTLVPSENPIIQNPTRADLGSIAARNGGFATAPSEATTVSPEYKQGAFGAMAEGAIRDLMYPANTAIDFAARRMESMAAGAAAPFARMASKSRREAKARAAALAAPRSALSVPSLRNSPTPVPELPDNLRPIENIMGAVRGAGEATGGAAKGLVLGQPPERSKIVPKAIQPYEPTEAFNQMLRWEGGVPPVPAALIDIASTIPAGEALATAARPVAGVLKMAGRAAEPLRQVRAIGAVGDLLSPGFSIPALKPGESKLDYILGNLPDNQRALFRAGQKKAAGEAALIASKRNDLMQIADFGRKQLMKRLTITPEEAQDILRTAAEELTRQGPKAVAGMTEPEIAAVNAMREIPKLEVAARLTVPHPMRANELASHVEKRAQIAEQRISKARGAQKMAKEASIPSPLEGQRPVRPGAKLRNTAGVAAGVTPGPTGHFQMGPPPSELAGVIQSQPPKPTPSVSQGPGSEIKSLLRQGPEIPKQPQALTVSAREQKSVAALARNEAMKARRSVQKFENVSGIGMPRNVKSRRIALGESEKLLGKRGEFFVDYQPGILGKAAREAETGGRFGGTPIEYSTNLGRRRKFPPTLNTAEREAIMLEKMARTPEKAKLFNKPALFGDEALGDKPRYFDTAFSALRKNGVNRDASLEHGYLISHVATHFGEDAYRPGLKKLGDLPFLSGFDKNSKAELSSKWIPEKMWNLMNDASRYGTRNYGGIEAAARQSLRYWKPLVTLTRPEFWVRNWAWSKYIRGVNGDINPMNDKFGIDLVARSNPGRAIVVNGRQMTVAQLHDEFVRNRIISASKAIDIGRSGAIGRAYQATEDSQRSAYAWYWLKRGKTIDQASEMVKRVFFNYGPEAFTPFEQKYLREAIFPFWAWPRNIVRLAGRTAGERPGAYGQLGVLQNSVSRALGYSAEDQDNFGEMYKTSGAIPLTPKAEADKTGKIKMFSLSGIGMVNDVNTLIGMRERGYLGPLTGAMSQLHPILSGAINLWFNPLQGNWVNKGNILDEMKGPVKQGKLPQVARLFVGKLPGIKAIKLPDGQTEVTGPNVYSAVFRSVGNVPNVPFQATDPDWKDYILAVRFATGIPIGELDMEKAAFYNELHRREVELSKRTLEQRNERLQSRVESGE